MTVLAATWLDISINLLLFVFVIVCLLMSMIILMQRPKNEGLGAAFGSGTTDQLFGARTTNVLQKGTVYLGSLFFVITLTLAILISKRNAGRFSLVAEAPPAPEVILEAPALPPTISEEAQLAGEASAVIVPDGETPATEAPAEEQPAETPAEAAPTEEAPAEEAPATETPAPEAEEAPAEPAEEAPAEEP